MPQLVLLHGPCAVGCRDVSLQLDILPEMPHLTLHPLGSVREFERCSLNLTLSQTLPEAGAFFTFLLAAIFKRL